jgi:hypothetical protein
MDPQLLIICCTIAIAVVSGRWYKLRSRELELRAIGGQSFAPQSKGEIAALREELAQLRDTTTKFDMSVESTLTEIQHRLSRLEAAQRPTPTTSSPEDVQSVAAGRQST